MDHVRQGSKWAALEGRADGGAAAHGVGAGWGDVACGSVGDRYVLLLLEDVVDVDGVVQRAHCPPWRVYRMWSSGLRLPRSFYHKFPASNLMRCGNIGKYSSVLGLLTVTWKVGGIIPLFASNALTALDIGDKVMDAFMTSNLSYEHLRKIQLVHFLPLQDIN